MCRRISGLGMQALAHWQHPSVVPKPKPPDPFAHLSPEPAPVAPDACAPAQLRSSAPIQGVLQQGDMPRASLGSLSSFPGDPFGSPSHAQPDHDATLTEQLDTQMHDATEAGIASLAPPISSAELSLPSNLDAASAAAAAAQEQPHTKSADASSAHTETRTASIRQCCRPPGAVLLDVLYWLASYVDLWKRPCSATGLLLAADYGSGQLVPPYVRPFWLTPKGLRAAALDAAQRRAFHCHAVPPECFAARGQ